MGYVPLPSSSPNIIPGKITRNEMQELYDLETILNNLRPTVWVNSIDNDEVGYFIRRHEVLVFLKEGWRRL